MSYKKSSKNFPNPLAEQEEKATKAYGLKFAKAIESQWGKLTDKESLMSRRGISFERNRDYANGTQDTNVYKKMLTSLDPTNSNSTLVNLDYTPVPILPKFVRIVVNKILSRNPTPNLEAVDPLSSSEKDKEKRKLENFIKMKKRLMALQQQTGMQMGDVSLEELPDTLEEAEIFMDANIKNTAEIAGQIGTNMTLTWNDFTDGIFRRSVNDLAALGMAVVRRSNDPNYGIKTEYVDPAKFVHSHTEDPGFKDLTYAGHIKEITIQELKRIAGNEIEDEDFEKLTNEVKGSSSYDLSYNFTNDGKSEGKDENMVRVLEFEFLSVDCMHFEEKENQHGNSNFFYEGYKYKEKHGSVFERKSSKMNVVSVYKGCYVLGTDYIYNYGPATNVPKNIHDITTARTSYSAISTNIRRMMPKSMVDGCIGFADMLQITHLKLQQAIAKAKPDGLIIDIEGLESVQLGKGGELEPLELHDIYEQTGIFYYRSKNPEGGFQNPPVRTIDNHIRNVNELVSLYNHYLRMIRDATGINEMMDGSTPKGETLVGVQQNAISAGNNAIYDITNASMILFKKVCEDIVKCLQIIPPESVLMGIYRNAIGDTNMDVLSSFSNLYMYNFGVHVVKEMEDQDRQYLEQSLQVALGQKEIDLEDAMAVRDLKDVNQAQRLLITRRKKRIASQQQQAQQNSQMQSQMAQQASQMAQQAKAQEMQMSAQLDSQKMQLQAQLDAQLAQVNHQFKKEIEIIKAQALLGLKEDDKEFKQKLEVLKENRKDDRVKKQAVEQSKLISQRDGKRSELPEESSNLFGNILTP